MRTFINLLIVFILAAHTLLAQGMVVGTVTFDGVANKRQSLKVTKDKHCIASLKGAQAQDLIVGAKTKGIKNVVVSIQGTEAELEPPEENPVIDQSKCRYVPHVTAVVVGTAVDIKNSDPVNHNVRSNPEENDPINYGMPIKDMVIPYEGLEEPEVIKLVCDVHNWMNAYIVVLDTPHFAVTDRAGAFEIANVPAGEDTINAWHETLGEFTQEVTVPVSGEAKVSFKLGLKKKKK